MFLRRNVASQQFTIPGSLRLIADGAAVTTGAAIYLNGSGTAGGGTLTHWRGGAWRYTPTQAESDVPIFEYVLEATAALPLSGSIRTTNADPNDGAGLGLSRVDQAIGSRSTFDHTSTSVTVGTNTDKTGYSLTQAFPTNFANLEINGSGHIERVVLVDTTTTNTDMRGTDGANTTTPLDAAGIRTAVGLASANLDTQLTAIDSVVDSILDDTGTSGVVISGASIDSIWDEAVEGSTTARQFLRGFAAALLAKASGLNTTTAVYRDTADTKARITATVDAEGNRSAVTLDLT
jgi:hypothetical protein